jgi:hypothetical protein
MRPYIQCITFLMLEIPIRVTNCESKHDCKRKGMPLIQVKFHGIIKKFHRDVPQLCDFNVSPRDLHINAQISLLMLFLG